MTLRVPVPVMDEFDAILGGRDRTDAIIDAMTAWIFVQKGMGVEGVPKSVRLQSLPSAPGPNDPLNRLLGADVELYCDHEDDNGECSLCGEDLR